MTRESFEEAVRKIAARKREPSPFIRKAVEALKPSPVMTPVKPAVKLPPVTVTSVLARLVVNVEQVRFEVEELKLRVGVNSEKESLALDKLIKALDEGPAWV